MILAAAKAHRKRYQREPVSMEDLVPEFIESVPVDPFDGEPFHWTTTRKRGTVVYSVGPDKKDDKGKVEVKHILEKREGDLVYPLYMPQFLNY